MSSNLSMICSQPGFQPRRTRKHQELQTVKFNMNQTRNPVFLSVHRCTQPSAPGTAVAVPVKDMDHVLPLYLNQTLTWMRLTNRLKVFLIHHRVWHALLLASNAKAPMVLMTHKSPLHCQNPRIRLPSRYLPSCSPISMKTALPIPSAPSPLTSLATSPPVHPLAVSA